MREHLQGDFVSSVAELQMNEHDRYEESFRLFLRRLAAFAATIDGCVITSMAAKTGDAREMTLEDTNKQQLEVGIRKSPSGQ